MTYPGGGNLEESELPIGEVIMARSFDEWTRSVGEDEIKHGYTVRDIQRMTRMAMTWARTRFLDSDDRHEAAYFAICEALLASPESPPERDLIAAGARAVDNETRAFLRHHGVSSEQPDSHKGSFVSFWLNQPHDFPDERLCEVIALPEVMARLTTKEREALVAYATFGNMADAATSLGATSKIVQGRVSRARHRFLEAWYDHETPPARRQEGTCKAGHDRSVYGKLPPSGHWYCTKCRREYRIRRRAKGKT